MSIGLINHPILGETRVYSRQGVKSLEYRANINSIQTQKWYKIYKLNEMLQKVKPIHTTQSSYCFYPYQVQQDVNVSSNKTLKIFYQNHFVSLKNQTANRIKKQLSYSKSQIYFVTYSVVLASMEWIAYVKQLLCKRHGEYSPSSSITDNLHNQCMSMIRTSGITVTLSSKQKFCSKIPQFLEYKAISSQHILLNQNGQIKLVTPISSPVEIPNIKYYPPQMQPQTQTKKVQQTPQKYLQTVQQTLSFSIGMIAVELMVLKSCQSFYDHKNGGILRYSQLIKWFSIYEKEYDQLWRLVNMMIQPQSKKRIKIGQVWSILKYYQQNILTMQEVLLEREQCRKYLFQHLQI